jgi:alpha-1,3-mannosyltransferase
MFFIEALLPAIDLALSGVIIKLINYTEIDWKAYMEQIETIREGERTYANIRVLESWAN